MALAALALRTWRRQRAARAGIDLPDVRRVLGARACSRLPPPDGAAGAAGGLPRRPGGRGRSRRPRAGSRSSPRRSPRFGYDDCPGHPVWLEPAEWLGSPLAERYPLHLVSNQPAAKLHSQYDLGRTAEAAQVGGPRAGAAHPPGRRRGARHRRRATSCGCSTTAAPASPAALVTDEVMPGVVVLPTGAWYDPLEPGGAGHARVARQPERADARQGHARSWPRRRCAHSCLVEVERFAGEAPRVAAFDPPPHVVA